MFTLTLSDLSRAFGERPVLKGLSTTLRGGERVLVRGPNGSGKTTLLKILAGVLRPSGGFLAFRDGEAPLEAAWQRRWTGYAAPDLVLYEEFSALENLTFYARLRGLKPDPARELALLDRVGLGRRSREPLGTLSTGLRQRAKLAFALQPDPRLLLLDEPGSNLDDLGRALVASIVEASPPERLVVIASNDPAEFALGTRTLELA